MVKLITHLDCLILKMITNLQSNLSNWTKLLQQFLRLTNGNPKYVLSYANTGFAASHVKTARLSKVVDLLTVSTSCSQSRDWMRNILLQFVRTSWNTLRNVHMETDVFSNIHQWIPAKSNQLNLSSARTLNTPLCVFSKTFRTQRLCTLTRTLFRPHACRFSNKLPPIEVSNKPDIVTDRAIISFCVLNPL